MQRKKCPNCGQFTFYTKETKCECINCGYRMQVQLAKIWGDKSKDLIIDRINGKFIHKRKESLIHVKNDR